MNYILASVLSNISFAVADNANGLLSRKNRALKIGLWVALLDVCLFLIPALTIFRGDFSHLTAANVAMLAGLGILANLGYVSFIMGMSRAGVTLTGVIGGSFPALTVIVSLLAFHESISFQQALAILLVLVGVALSSMHAKAGDLLKGLHSSGVIYAFGSLVFWGVYFAFIRMPVEQIGWFLPQYSVGVVGLIMFTAIAITRKQKDVFTRPRPIAVFAACVILGGIGNILYSYAISQGQTAVVAPIAGSSPVVFVIIAYFIFKEKLNKKQWVGICLALLGIVALSILSV